MGVLYSIWGTFHRQGALLWEVNAPTMHVLQAWSLGKDNMSLLKTYYNVLYIHTYVPISVVIPLATQASCMCASHMHEHLFCGGEVHHTGIADVFKGPAHCFMSAYRDWTDSLNMLHCHHSQPHPLPRLPFLSAKGWPPKLADQWWAVDSCHLINEALFVWGWR